MRESTMRHTDRQQAEFKERFAKKRRSQIILVVPVVAVLLMLALSEGKQAILGIPLVVAGAVGATIILGSVVFSLFNWRCPACNKYLGRGLSPKFCAKCGVQLS